MIRQAISCDVCGSEKRQTNHWFVAFEQGGELRIGGWSSRNRAKSGSKHLCGQTCVHKLVDEFMAKTVNAKPVAAVEDEVEVYAAPNSDLPLAHREVMAARTGRAMEKEVELGLDDSSARLITPMEPALPIDPAVQYEQIRPVTPIRPTRPFHPRNTPSQPSNQPTDDDAIPIDEPVPDFTSHEWRAAAWQRERERTLHVAQHNPGLLARFRPN